jgi:SAM-dependent methyltransferase
LGYLSAQRAAYARDLADSPAYWSLSAVLLASYRATGAMISKYARGEVLDAGAGSKSARQLLAPLAKRYVSLDVKAASRPDIVADLHDLRALASQSFDTVLCSQVFEYLHEPPKAISEIHRVLRRGGHAIISAPFLAGLHDEPHDLFRYSPHGLKYLMTEAGFEIVDEQRVGGLAAFITHPVSWILVSAAWGLPVVRWIMWGLNKLLIVHPAIWIDRILGLERIFPSNALVVGRRS